jgi:hypothetical protein
MVCYLVKLRALADEVRERVKVGRRQARRCCRRHPAIKDIMKA